MIQKAFQSFRKQLYYIFGILLIGWLCTPYADHFLGLGVGLVVSMYCGWMLGRRIEKMGEHIVLSKKLPSLGAVNRFAAAVLGALFLYEIEHQMVMWAFATGILGGYFLLVINLGYYSAYYKEEKELYKYK
ncbi:ATP synthase subunit I [Ectobacillus antri]|jgi:ATP synthase protein I|uniref:ATP synthase subunit I n=1 Tax=Ectobacillus antri TaxID=2486280 RepID=A0ABT6H603_9BACI|nr:MULTISPECIES: ATP synthase subunit I [Ectobacillus]MDG4657374.1 ATP synthase subunit I [Ectobacillus antri]MDG5754495.1 ATP synthase subunit I [Ectobacillus antri]UOY91906.1 ATP synthase subunit I [Ectobacillus sp. JY-23]